MLSTKSNSTMQEVGVVLHNVKQLRIESSGKPTPRGTLRDKMAANSRRRKKARNKRTKSTDNSRTVELRKERSRDAARSRRGKENAQFDELAKLLPLPGAITSQLDKASVVRLTISYLNMKQFNLPKRVKRYRQGSDCSFHSESSASPQSEVDVDAHFGSAGSPSPNSSLSSPPAAASSSAGAVSAYNPNEITLQDLADNSGIFLLQALDGFLFVLSGEGKVLYVSETVSVHLGLSQVELTGSNISCYIHPEDHPDVMNVLAEARDELENAEHVPSGRYTDNIPFFGNQQAFPGNENNAGMEKPKSFFMRMKCTLVRRGGAYTKSSGFKVIHCMGRMKQYFAKGLPDTKYAFVAIGQPLPTMNINELPLECNMFVSRVNMDLKIVYCEGRIHKFMDYFARDIVGISAYDFYHANDIAVIQGHHAKFLNKGQVLTKYYRWMNKNGGWVWMQTKASLIPHPTNPELKQMLCLNYIVSEVEHRGVVLGMMQLDDKPSFQPRAYITEIENETDETGQLKDAQFDDQVMVYPKWHENSDKLVPKPTLLDQMALTRSGYTRSTSCETPLLQADDVFTSTASEPCSKSATVTTWSPPTRGYSGQGDSTSTYNDEIEDLTEIISAELTKMDRELVHFVANGQTDTTPTLTFPDASVDGLLNGDWFGVPSNGTIQSGISLGGPKIEPISIEEEADYNQANMPPSGIPSQSSGNLPVGCYPNDTKPNLIPMEQENIQFQLSSAKMRGVNNPCMFSNGNSGTERNYQQNVPVPNNYSAGNAPMMGLPQQKLTVPSTRNANNVKMPGAAPRIPAYTSTSQEMGMSGQLTTQGPTTTATSTVTVGSFMSSVPNRNDFVQLLKEAIPDTLAYTDEMVVDLVDDMLVDQDEAQRRKDDERLASQLASLQQGGYVQPELGFIKQEVVTPTLPQQTFSFPNVSNSIATQGSQPDITSAAIQSFAGNRISSNTTFGGQQNGTINNQNASLRYQNGNSQFMNQEDSNMNFLNSLSNVGLTNKRTGLPVQGSNLWNTNPPSKPNIMQQGLRNLLQSPNSIPAPTQNTLPVSLPQSDMPFLPQQNVNLNTQGSSFNMTMVPNLSHLETLLQSTQLPANNYQNLNGTSMVFSNQNSRKV